MKKKTNAIFCELISNKHYSKKKYAYMYIYQLLSFVLLADVKPSHKFPLRYFA